MGTLSRERFDNLLATSQHFRSEVAQAIGGSYPWLNSNDPATLAGVYDQVRDYIVTRGYVGGKYLRPWLVDKDFTAHLNRDEAWWGFEFETGYVSSEARGTVNRFVWDNFDGVAFDAEGEGNAAVEITFGPEERSKFLDGTAQAVRFIEFLTQNSKLVQKGGGQNVGTHLNFSHPKLTAKNQGDVALALSRTVGALPVEIVGHGNCRHRLFGRSRLYGGFYCQNQGGKQWIEGKLFRTVYTTKQFQQYIQTADALSICADKIFDALESTDSLAVDQRLLKALPYVNNLWEMVTEGAEPELMWFVNTSGGDHNNGWHRDTHPNKHPQTREAMREAVEAKRKEEELRKQREAEEKRRAELEKELSRIHTAIFKDGRTPTNMPEGFYYCDSCEVYHNDDDVIFEGRE